VGEMLDALMRKEIKTAILSNKPDDFTKLCVEKILPKWKFDIVQGVEPGGSPKPDPSSALKISETLGIRPAEFVYLGDTNTDMQTAVAAGMSPIGALWGFRSAEELLDNGAKVLIEKPGDLLNFFQA
jgi:phosphoglycolate phosphatase